MIKVQAINNEYMWLDEKDVVMVGPRMDRGLRELGVSVLYLRGLPPLPVKEIVDELAKRVEEGIKYGTAPEGEAGSGSADGHSGGGTESRLVVP